MTTQENSSYFLIYTTDGMNTSVRKFKDFTSLSDFLKTIIEFDPITLKEGENEIDEVHFTIIKGIEFNPQKIFYFVQ